MDDGLAVRLTQRLTSRQKLALDTLLGAALAATSVPVTQHDMHAQDMHASASHGPGFAVVSYLAVACAAASLPARRRYPRASLAVAVLAEAVLIGLGERLPVLLAPGFAMYTVAAASAAALPYRIVVATLVPLITGGLLAWDGHAAGNATLAALLASGSILVGWLAGENARARRSHARDQAERERERARHTLMEERARIARELHDAVAHAMSVISVRSGIARRLSAGRPGQDTEALAIIEVISRQGLAELRRLVAVLREADEPAAVDLQPARGLADLPELVSHIGAAGVGVDVRIDGQPRPLPPTEDLTAYRIAQEALTNVVRHSADRTATLSLRYRDGSVEIECVNPCRPRAQASRHGGHGLVGMRERVALYGGEFSAGPGSEGFRVRALLPVPGEHD